MIGAKKDEPIFFIGVIRIINSNTCSRATWRHGSVMHLLTAHALTIGIIQRLRNNPGRVHLSINFDLELGAVSAEVSWDVA